MTQSLISVNRNWQPKPEKNLVAYIPEKEGVKYDRNIMCEKCSGYQVDASYCTECRNVIQKGCIKCGTKTLVDTHDFCYCQLDVLVPQNW